MRRTVLSAAALACTAVLASTVPAFADGPSPVPTVRPTATTAPAPSPATPTPSAAPTRAQVSARPVPSAVPARGQVSVVPKGAPDTGVAPVASRSGPGAGLVGRAAAAVFATAGAAVFVVRRRRATGA
ncbi:sortase-dependent protein [Streptomyces caeni]|uniref:Sortase-dependent protein n=1 Tax=Streptomyces caeni TaxID=2307231 RepID=A0ABW4IUQ8_9ACTN